MGDVVKGTMRASEIVETRYRTGLLFVVYLSFHPTRHDQTRYECLRKAPTCLPRQKHIVLIDS